MSTPQFRLRTSDAMASGDTRTLDEVLTEMAARTITEDEDRLVEALRYAAGCLSAKERARVLELIIQ